MKKTVGLLIIFILLINLFSLALADEPNIHEFMEESTRGSCPVCFVGETFVLCDDMNVYYDSGTHRYGFLWLYTCRVDYFVSNGYVICDSCYSIIESWGYHGCLEVHRDCGLGSYEICPFS